MPISGNPENDKRQIPAAKIKGAKPTNAYPVKPGTHTGGLNWEHTNTNTNEEIIITPPTGGGNNGGGTIDESTPNPPGPGVQTANVAYATIDNPIIIDIARPPADLDIKDIEQRWPNWNGLDGAESDFIPLNSRANKLVVEPVQMPQNIWTGQLDNPYNNKHASVPGTNNPNGEVKLEADGTIKATGHIAEEEISLATWAKNFKKVSHNRTTLTDFTDQNPYNPVHQTVNKNNGHNFQIYRYKIYNTYWANQGKYETTQNGVPHYTAKNLNWIVNIVQLPTPKTGESPINPYCAFLGMVQNHINGLENLDTTHFENAAGMLAFNPCLKTQYTLNLPNLQHADFMFAGNLEYNQPTNWTMPKLKTITFAHFDNEALNQPATNLLHSPTVQRAEAYIAAGYNQANSLKNLQYPNIAEKPDGYNLETPNQETYWD
jgi:hypothetical protein